MTDLFGLPLQVGDEVIYTTGGRGNAMLERGIILEITMGRAYLKSANGKRLTNPRYSYDLVSANPIKQANPELFI